MLAFAMLAAIGSQFNPIISIGSPQVLCRSVEVHVAGSSQDGLEEWRRTDRALDELAALPRRSQIAVELAYAMASLREAPDPRRYDWDGTWDLGRLDTIAIAIGKGPILYDPKSIRFLRQFPLGSHHVEATAGWSDHDREADFDCNRPSAFYGKDCFREIRRRILRGYFVISRTSEPPHKGSTLRPRSIAGAWVPVNRRTWWIGIASAQAASSQATRPPPSGSVPFPLTGTGTYAVVGSRLTIKISKRETYSGVVTWPKEGHLTITWGPKWPFEFKGTGGAHL